MIIATGFVRVLSNKYIKNNKKINKKTVEIKTIFIEKNKLRQGIKGRFEIQRWETKFVGASTKIIIFPK